ncbi:MAG TPA: glutathione S-transferase family protein [Aestuariivirgaceae bacterium]|nr:glutathione S-transferase family protein [Aestuariivirgaceae bacterium]
MYTVYGRIGTGSIAVEAVLEETGAPFQVRDVVKDPDGRPPADYFDIHPQGRVPAMILPDGKVMTESAAIVIHLADSHPEARLAPPHGAPDRAAFLSAMLFLATGIYNSDLIVVYAPRYTTDAGGADGVRAAALEAMEAEWRVFERMLGGRRYILGDAFSAADIYAAMLMTWNEDVPAFFRDHPELKAHHDRVASRPPVARAWKRHGLEA